MKIYARNYRGFKRLEVDLSKLTFLVGDNSSGKSSILYLISALCGGGLLDAPQLDEDYGVGRYDYFSPYFNFDDVTFAIQDFDDGNLFVKIITVEKHEGNKPKIKKYSYLKANELVSFTHDKSAIYYKTITNFEFSSIDNLLEFHDQNLGYEALDKDPDGDPLYQGILYYLFAANKNGKLNNSFSAFFGSRLPDMRLISPIRALPEKFYKFRRKFEAQGLHFPTMWFNLSSLKGSEALTDVDSFGKESSLFDNISVEKLNLNIDESPLIVTIDKNGKNFFLHQLGIGVSQVIPVLMETVFTSNEEGNGVLVQQPELHLHPVAQAALGSYFYKCWVRGLRGVLETHSSYLIDRFRADLRDGILKIDVGMEAKRPNNDNVTVLFCENKSDGNHISEVKISEDGNLLGEPDEFHKFFVDELLRTMF